MIKTVLLVAVLAIAIGCDLRLRRIPNGLTGAAACAGLVASLAPGGIGLRDALGGLAIGLLPLLPLYACRAMGAGDVKLMAAAGTFLGMADTFAALVYAAALGGLLALTYAWKAGVLASLFANLRVFALVSAARIASRSAPSMEDLPLTQVRAPYVLAIAGGVLIQLLSEYLRRAGA